MTTSTKRRWLTEHRGWEDSCSAVVGILILFSPIFVGSDPNVATVVSAVVAGGLISLLALLEMMVLRRWEEVMELVCGIWVVVSPVVLQYGGTLRILHFALGGAVIVLALLELWQDRNRRLEG